MNAGNSRVLSGLDQSSRGEHRRAREQDRARLDDPRGVGWIVHAAVIAGCALLFAAGLFWGGFMVFAADVSGMKARPVVDADGIVVLTGGAERVAGAMELLADGHARRLLISGVHPDTSARQIGKLVDAGPSIFDCCVDLDRRAANTIGNASETAKWVRANAFSSLIVVTSAYHMPRSLVELGSAMPEIALRPYAVSPPMMDLERWYLSADTMALLLEEYLKYMAAKARLTLYEAGLSSPILADLAP